jgi:hypothetical protein
VLIVVSIFSIVRECTEDFRRKNKEAVIGSDPEPIGHISAAAFVAYSIKAYETSDFYLRFLGYFQSLMISLSLYRVLCLLNYIANNQSYHSVPVGNWIKFI